MPALSRIVLPIVAVSLVLLTAEIVARLVAEEPTPATRGAESALDLPELQGFDIAKKNVRGRHMGVFFRTNSEGIRGPEYARKPGEGVFRILIAGDSVTMGWGVAAESAYPALLERKLNASSDGRRYEVLNVGLAGINASFANRRLVRLAEIYEPDLTIYGFTLNDIEGPQYRKSSSARSEADRELWRRALRFHDSPSYLLRALWPRWILLGYRPDDESEELIENYFENPAAWRAFVAGLDLHAQYVERRGICGHVLVHTHLRELGPTHPYEAIYARVGEAAAERGLTVTQSRPYFVGLRAEDLWLNAMDIHPGPGGHEILATALLEGLRRLPEACWRDRAAVAQ